MTFTLLLDLDDTLLDTNIDSFIPAYFKKLTGFMAGRIPPDKFINALLQSTQIMYGNVKTDQTLEQAFDQYFYSSLGFEKEQIAPDLEIFYDEVFPTLGNLTKPRAQAVELVEWAFSKGWDVAIATDPLFPRKAILHRLRWAGLAPEIYPFKLISDFQTFHFAKASVAYYPEFLAKMNWVDEPVLMVGDSLERDVLPSQKAGVPVYWLNNDQSLFEEGVPQGWYEHLTSYLENKDLSTLKVNNKSLDGVTAFLQATPAILHNNLMDASITNSALDSKNGEWSLKEILCHLRDVDNEVNIPRLQAIINTKNPTLAGVSTDQWAVERNYSGQDTWAAFTSFVQARQKLVSLFGTLNSGDWSRRANHTFLGPTTLNEMAEIMVEHDRQHIFQVKESLK